MNGRTQRVFVWAFTFLLITAPITSSVDLGPASEELSPIGSALADASDSIILDDAEDNDENIEASGWDGYRYENGDSISTTSTDSISGNYSQKISNAGNVERVSINSSTNQTPSRLGFRASVLKQDGDVDDNMNIRYKSNGATFVDIEFEAGTKDLEVNGNVIEQYSVGEVYEIELTNVNYTADTFVLYVNHEKIGKYSFSTNVDGVQEIEIESDSNINSKANTLVFDDIQLNGTRYNPPAYTSDIDGGFEDGDVKTDKGAWVGWSAKSGSVSSTSTDPIAGGYSLSLATDGNDQARLETERGDLQNNSFQTRLRIKNDVGDTNDNTNFRVRDDGNILMGVEFEAGSRAIKVKSNGTSKDINQNWVTGHVYNISIRNVSWQNNKYSLYINGEKEGRYLFYKNSSDYEAVELVSDNNINSQDDGAVFDDVAIDGKEFKTHKNSLGVGFEDQTADSGTPDGWSRVDSGSADHLNVTTVRSYEGAQSIYWGESQTGSYLELQHNDMPYGHDLTGNVTVAIYKTTNDSDGNANDATSVRLLEDGQLVGQAGVDNHGNLQWSGSTQKNLTVVGTGEWVKITITDIDPKNDTATVVYENATASGKFTGLSFANDVDGYDDVRLRTDENGYHDALKVNGGKLSGGNDVTGKVVTQSDAPIENATLKLVISKKPTVPKAQEQLENLSDPVPNSFQTQVDQDLNLRQDRWKTSSVDRYAAIYTAEDFGIKFTDTADLSTPLWRSVPADEDLVIGVGDPDAGGIVDRVQEFNRQVPGAFVNGKVLVERLAADGSVTSSTTYKTKKQSESQLGPAASVVGVPYAEVQSGDLRPGFYRITVMKDGSKASIPYIVRVGTPHQIVNQYREDINGKLTDQAKQIRDEISAGGISTVTTTTNATGHWSVQVSSNAELVQVQAYKAPGVDVKPKNRDMGNITKAYEGTDISNESVYIPSRTYRVEPPASGVTVRMTELSFPPTGGNISALRDQIQNLRDLLQNRSLAGSIPATLRNQSNLSRTQLETTFEGQLSLIETNDQIREVYLDLSGRNEVPNADDLTRSELADAIRYANQAISAVESTSPENVETSTTSNTVSLAWTDDIPDGAAVTIWAEYSNGTKTKVPDKYITLDTGIGSDTVSVNEFPLGDAKPAAVSFRLQVAGANEVIEDTKTVTNPTFSGNVPGLQALDYSSLRPGPDEPVTLTVRGGDKFANVSSASVIGPGGKSIPATIDGNQITFKTNGAGQHKIRYTVSNLGGKQFTAVSTVRAASSDQAEEPTVAARENVLGTYAVVGTAFKSGSVSTGSGETTIQAQIPDKASAAPSRVHVHAEDLTPESDSIQFQIVKGPDQQSIDEHVLVFYHSSKLDEDTLVWRGEDEPITRDGSTKYGAISSDSDGTTIKTFTAGDGQLSLEIARDPGFAKRAEHRIDQVTLPSNIPVIGIFHVPELPKAPTASSGVIGTLDSALPAAGWAT